jgi:hypothetical protein
MTDLRFVTRHNRIYAVHRVPSTEQATLDPCDAQAWAAATPPAR